MDTEPFAPLPGLTPDQPDARPGPGFRGVNAALRAEALRLSRWQQREWARTLTTHTPGNPRLVVSAARAGLTDGLDVLRQAGEDVPSWFDHGGSLVWTRDAASGTGRAQLADLLADITRVLAGFDSAPSALGEGFSSEHPWRGAGADVAGDDSGARKHT